MQVDTQTHIHTKPIYPRTQMYANTHSRVYADVRAHTCAPCTYNTANICSRRFADPRINIYVHRRALSHSYMHIDIIACSHTLTHSPLPTETNTRDVHDPFMCVKFYGETQENCISPNRSTPYSPWAMLGNYYWALLFHFTQKELRGKYHL